MLNYKKKILRHQVYLYYRCYYIYELRMYIMYLHNVHFHKYFINTYFKYT